MSTYAGAQILGRLGQDPQERVTSSGTPMTTMSLATSRKVRGEEKTLWHKVLCFGKNAENAAKYLEKGRSCYVSGTLDYETYTNKNGVDCHVTVIVAKDIVFTGGVDKQPVERTVEAEKPIPVVKGGPVFDDDIPF